MIEKALGYSDVYLVPNYSEVKSRSEVDTSVNFLGRKFKLPIVPSNMECVIDRKIAKWLSENDYFYIYHRFEKTRELISIAKYEKWKTISISVGVKDEDKNLIKEICHYQDNVHFVTIDVANGHHQLVINMIAFIKEQFKISNLPCPKIIAGNIATPEAVEDLQKYGADAVKVGIAGGGVCSTKNMTGFHIPMFSCIERCMSAVASIPIIADGGIRENGDIAKSLVAGADMVMIGGMLAACKDSAAKYHEDVMKYPFKKIFHGSASYQQKGNNKHIEGFESLISCNNMTYEEKYEEMKQSLQSSCSYAGGKSLNCLKTVSWVTTK